jgi:hypothetical protein
LPVGAYNPNQASRLQLLRRPVVAVGADLECDVLGSVKRGLHETCLRERIPDPIGDVAQLLAA